MQFDEFNLDVRVAYAGIRMLLLVLKAVSEKSGGRFAVASPEAPVRKVLCDSGLDTCISVASDVAAALD